VSNFDDYEGNVGPWVGIDRLLQGDGWDSPIRRIFTEVDPEEDEIEEDQGFVRNFERCTCDFAKIRDAADELVKFLQSAPQRIPKSGEQLESFRALGGYASGKWSRYVRVASSVPYESETGGVIHLYGCSRPEHQIRVILAGEIEIREQIGLQSADASTAPWRSQERRITDQIDDQDEYEDELPEVSQDAIEAEEERRYDERTYGQFADDEDSDPEIDIEKTEAIKNWRDVAVPEHEVDAFLDAKLDLSEVHQLSRLMPANEVASWVDWFGEESMLAFEFLRIGVGELSFRPEFASLNIDDVAADVIEGIRKVIFEVFDKYEDKLDFSGAGSSKAKSKTDEEEDEV